MTAIEASHRPSGAKRLAEQLRAECVHADGDLYVNGDRLAAELGGSPAEFERLLRELSGSALGLDVSLEPGASPPVWRVSRR